MDKLLRVLCAAPAIFFVVVGLRWLIDPAGIAPELGMPLLEGIGLSTQIGDLAVLFLSIGMMMLLAVITSRRHWFHVPALMLLGAAGFRVIAWLLHDAAFAGQLVALEFGVACLLLFAASRLASRE
jgi:hypothetical protein